MGYLIGTDEAGYAPNLGPLVVSATVWQVPGDPRRVDLYQLLEGAVSCAADRSRRAPRLVLADSKVVYKAGGGLAALETGVLAALGLLGPRPETWHGIWRQLAPDGDADLAAEPWHLDYEHVLPLAAAAEEIDRHTLALGRSAGTAGVRLLAVRSRAVFADRWNRLLDEHGEKSTALSRITLELLAETLAPLAAEPVAVVCDKHGGRNRYRGLLQQYVTESLVEIHGEGRDESLYRFGPAERRTEIAFRAKAERHLGVALASMTSKYLRELAMRAFNQFWLGHLPDLRPTAGYPGDAGRFKADIAELQTALGIDDRVLWRNK